MSLLNKAALDVGYEICREGLGLEWDAKNVC